MAPEAPEASVGELLGSLASTTASLVRQEVQLASAEIGHKVSAGGVAVGKIAGSALVMHAGLLFLLGAAALGLGTVLPIWAATLVVGGVTLAIGYTLYAGGKKTLTELNFVPRRAIESVQHDASLAKEVVR